ncbi:MAG: RNA polymerase-associated protein rapA [Gammaproteobacteria bacterium]|nr:RNA polymerase-associated protein rapA [Gammaproteobacteria bacterium]MCP5136992.1 RNA polymerase-associated protein rapA [Gammaproteobacteria bacterium]
MKSTKLRTAILAAIAAPTLMSSAQAGWEFNGYLKSEVAATVDSGEYIGARRATNDTTQGHSSGDVYKSELSARMFINGDIFESSSLHADVNLMVDPDATPKGYRGPKAYTQQDPLRELYIDTSIGDTYVRLGKQQVVWGTADGIKLLDIINPTDYREFAQNTMEDSRIPVWMVNVDTPIGDSGSLQFILSQTKENQVPGLRASGDAGHPFLMKGVDSITGPVNGFLNIGPAMGNVARFFAEFPGGGSLAAGAPRLRAYTQTRVVDYINDVTTQDNTDYNGGGPANGLFSEADFRGTCDEAGVGGNTTFCEAIDLNYVSQTSNTITGPGGATGTGGSNGNVTNLLAATDGISDGSALNIYNIASPTSMFEYMDQTAFSTFSTFVNMNTEFRTKNMPDDTDVNFGARFKGSTDGGTNFSVNYLYAYDANPYIDLHWEDASGNRLYVQETNANRTRGGGTTAGETTTITTLGLYKDAAFTSQHLVENDGAATLVFDEKMARIHNLGASFDTAFDMADTPLVVRGEFLYQKDVRTPVVNLAELRIGNVEEALKSQESDWFKYVIGVDATVWTNLLISGQFIQFINLDYVDETVQANPNNASVTGRRYSADPSTLHLTNGLKKAEEYKEFYSLFFSKPFGEAQLGRFNNITIFEEGGGYWNRMDVEYSFSDNLVGSAEWNQYWGDEDTTFGQFDKSSNFQIGVKYIF